MTMIGSPHHTTLAARLRVAAWAGAAALLLLPLVAMQVTGEVRWTPGDFGVFAAMLGAALGGYEVLARRAPATGGATAYRLGAALALGTAFLLVWINAAVGIIGSERNPANLLYAGVLAALGLGATLARLRAAGLARALFATAAAQVAVAAIVASGALRGDEPVGTLDLLAPTAGFTALWLGAALLFRRTSRQERRAA